MAYSSKAYSEIAEAIVEQITKAVVSEKHIYDPTTVAFRLGPDREKVRDIVKVEGLLKGARHTFRKEADYRLTDGSLRWNTGGDKPDEKTPFYVNYTFGDPSGITDANPGSVVRTIIEAISREIEYLYVQMDYVYRSGFVDTATGNSLDLIVALLGIQRKPAQPALGTMTFGRKSSPAEVAVSDEVFLFDGRDQYELRHTPVKEIQAVKGVVKKAEVAFQKGVEYDQLDNLLNWLPGGGRRPDALSEFRVDYKAHQRIAVPAGTRVSTFTRRPEDAKIFLTSQEKFLEMKPDGSWEADTPVRAIAPGPDGNVLSGSITLMPQPVEGIEFVINRLALTGGSESEGDEELRERAKRELRALGKATYTSLKQQIEDVEGVVRPIKIQEMPIPFTVESSGGDGKSVQMPVPGVVRVIVDGGDEKEIRRVIDETRAAGVYVELARPRLVLLDVKATVHLEADALPLPQLETSVRTALQQYIGALQAGDTIIFSRMVSAVLGVKGVRDVEGLVAEAYREGQPMRSTTKDNIELQEDEKVRLRNVTAQTPPEEGA